MSESSQRIDLVFTLPTGEVTELTFASNSITVGLGAQFDVDLSTVFTDLLMNSGYLRFQCTLDGTQLDNHLSCALSCDYKQIEPAASAKIKHGDTFRIGTSQNRIQFKYAKRSIHAKAAIVESPDSPNHHQVTDTRSSDSSVSSQPLPSAVHSDEVPRKIALHHKKLIMAVSSVVLIALLVWVFYKPTPAPEVHVVATTGEVLQLSFPQLAAEAGLEVDEHRFTYTLGSDAPESITIAGDKISARWTPQIDEPSFNGSFDLLIQDATNTSDVQVLKVHYIVNVIEMPPIVEAIPDQTVLLSDLHNVEFSLTAIDPNQENGKLVHTVIGALPKGATFDTTTGMFSFTPQAKDMGNIYAIHLRTYKAKSPTLATDTRFQIELVDDVTESKTREQVLRSLHIVWAKAPDGIQPIPIATTMAIAPTILLTNARIINTLIRLKKKGWSISHSLVEGETFGEISNLFLHSWYLDIEDAAKPTGFEHHCNLGIIQIATPVESTTPLASDANIAQLGKGNTGILLTSNISERLAEGNVLARIELIATSINDADHHQFEFGDMTTSIGLLKTSASLDAQVDGAPLIYNDTVIATYATGVRFTEGESDESRDDGIPPNEHLFTTIGIVHHFFQQPNRHLWNSVLPKEQ